MDHIDNDAKALKAEIFKIAWYMRGAVNMDDAFAMSYEDRMIMSQIVEDNLETTKKTGLPFF